MREYLLIACPNLRQEIQSIMEADNLHYEVMWLPEELHHSPDRLRTYLDQTISRLKDVERVILPMGRCGNGTIGVHSYSATLILPKCDDCIDLLLSGEGLAHVRRPERTYFFTDGWLKGERSFLREYAYMCQRFSEETARELAGMIYRNYRQFGYIDTGFGSFAQAAARAEALAQAVGVKRYVSPAGMRSFAGCCADSSIQRILSLSTPDIRWSRRIGRDKEKRRLEKPAAAKHVEKVQGYPDFLWYNTLGDVRCRNFDEWPSSFVTMKMLLQNCSRK